jgi:hypothetical protein
MSMFREYEGKVLRLLVAGVLSPEQLEAVVREGELVSYDYTVSGYFLTVRHASLPEERVVCDRPLLTGSADGVICGFVIFIENGEITIECHSWGDVDVPEGFRDKEVLVATT